MSRALHPVHGGLMLPGEKQRAVLKPLWRATVPKELVLPLNQHAGFTLTPCVAAGDHVLLGQVIAHPAEERGVPLHSPVSGSVLAIEARPADAANMSATAIVLDNDGRDERDETLARIEDFTCLDPDQLRQRLAAGGIVGLGGAVFPTHLKLVPAATPIGHLLLNGVECEPFICCDDALMRHRAADVVFGAQVLLHILGATRCSIAIEADKPEAITAMQAAIAAAADSRLEVSVVPTFYPAGGERQLIATLTGKEVPTRGLPRDIAIVCQNVGTAAAIARLLHSGEPLISRIVTVTGRGIREPGNLEVRLGTPISHLITECGGYSPGVTRLIAGGSMMGTALPHDDFPVTKATNCIIAATPEDLALHGPEMPCIRCGRCAEVCPASLLPQELHRFARAADEAMQERYGMLDCIECGCCDYVCPSHIPLTATFVHAKSTLLDAHHRREHSALLRERYRAHTDRLAAQQVEKQRKLQEKRTALKRTDPL